MSIDVLLPAALAFIMFSVGLALRAEDFRHVFQAPRALLIGLCGQLVLVPLAALAVVFVFDLPPALGIGLMILAACPGGASSGFLTHVARGNAALSLTLTVISSLAALATFPLLVKLVLAWLGEGVFGAGAVVLQHRLRVGNRDGVLELVAAVALLGRLQGEPRAIATYAHAGRHRARFLGEIALDDALALATVEDPHIADQESAFDLSRHDGLSGLEEIEL